MVHMIPIRTTLLSYATAYITKKGARNPQRAIITAYVEVKGGATKPSGAEQN